MANAELRDMACSLQAELLAIVPDLSVQSRLAKLLADAETDAVAPDTHSLGHG